MRVGFISSSPRVEKGTDGNRAIYPKSDTQASEASDNVFNIPAIENIREVEKQTGKPLLPSIFEGFVNQMTDKLEDIQSQIEAADAENLYRTAHAIKSMSANIGAKKVCSISAIMESAGRDRDLKNMAQLYSELDDSYKEFVGVFTVKFLSE